MRPSVSLSPSLSPVSSPRRRDCCRASSAPLKSPRRCLAAAQPRTALRMEVRSFAADARSSTSLNWASAACALPAPSAARADTRRGFNAALPCSSSTAVTAAAVAAGGPSNAPSGTSHDSARCSACVALFACEQRAAA